METNTIKKETVSTPVPATTKPVPFDVHSDPKFVLFAQWTASSKRVRGLLSEEQFAIVLGVSPQTLNAWKENPNFKPLVMKLMLNILEDFLPDALESLCINALAGGRAEEVKLMLELTGYYNNK